MIGMERIDGWSVREVLGGGAEGEGVDDDDEEADEEYTEETVESVDPSLGNKSADQAQVLSEGWLALCDRGVPKGRPSG